MPGTTEYHSAITSDAGIVSAFERIAGKLEQGLDQCSLGVSVIGNYNFNPDAFPLSEIKEQPWMRDIEQTDGATWESASVNLPDIGMHLSVSRRFEEGYDHIHISFNPDPKDPAIIRHAVLAVQEQLVPRYHAAALERALGPEMAEFYRLREEGLSRLEALTRSLAKENHDYRKQLDVEAAEHNRVLTESFENKKAELESQYEARTNELSERQVELDRLRQELDDRSARHARREQSRELQKKISERSVEFDLTLKTRRKRMPIHAIFLSLLGYSLFSTVTGFFATGLEPWVAQVRFVLGTVGFALTAVFYIRWNDHWFRRHADQEFKLQQLALDVDRAGYAVEMLMEWQEDKGGEMPAVVVDRLTAGMFTEQTSTERAQHPSEDVASKLLKLASNVRLELPGIGEVDMTGRRIRKLDRKS